MINNFLKQIRSDLKVNADKAFAESSERFFKEGEHFLSYGLKSSEVRKLGKKYISELKNLLVGNTKGGSDGASKSVSKNVSKNTSKKNPKSDAKSLSKNDIFSLCEELWKSGYQEEVTIACMLTESLSDVWRNMDSHLRENDTSGNIDDKCDNSSVDPPSLFSQGETLKRGDDRGGDENGIVTNASILSGISVDSCLRRNNKSGRENNTSSNIDDKSMDSCSKLRENDNQRVNDKSGRENNKCDNGNVDSCLRRNDKDDNRNGYENDFNFYEHILKNYVKNWAMCDTFCNHTVGDLIMLYPKLVTRLLVWARADNRWVKRGAAVSLIIPARKGLFLPQIFKIANTLLLDADDMVQKGYGWMLKVASETSTENERKVFEFVIRHRKTMPRTSLRCAIEKMSKEMRKEAMSKE